MNTFTPIAYIYALCDEATPDDIRYVGKTERPDKRIKLHISSAKKRWDRDHRSRWVNSVIQAGRRIIMRIITIVPLDKWQQAERDCIELCSHIHRLTNGNQGGVGGGIPQDWVREKMSRSAIARGEKSSAKQSNSIRALWRNPEYRRMMVKAHTGKKQSAEHIEKRTKHLRGRFQSEAERARRRAAVLSVRGVPVARTDTGEQFDSCSAAARAVGAPYAASITTALRRGKPWRGIMFTRSL